LPLTGSPIYFDTEMQFIYQSIKYILWSKTGVLNFIKVNFFALVSQVQQNAATK